MDIGNDLDKTEGKFEETSNFSRVVMASIFCRYSFKIKLIKIFF